MSRVIKFRAWHNAKQIMFPIIAIGLADGRIEVEPAPDSSWTTNLSDVELMQFTGLLDKNGKEIFEGDIVSLTQYEQFRDRVTPRIQIVRYVCEEKGRVGFAPMVWHTSVDDGYYNNELEDYEVMGNIYENPELVSA